MDTLAQKELNELIVAGAAYARASYRLKCAQEDVKAAAREKEAAFREFDVKAVRYAEALRSVKS